jgi:hypothetical protein
MAGPGIIERLDPISLDELDAVAALLTRRDRKYVVPMEVAELAVERLGDVSRVLDIDGRRRFHYESVYFDTPDGVSYLAAAHRRPRRFKVRTRSYLDSGRCLLEIKTRDPRGRTAKQRFTYPIERREGLDPAGRAFVAHCDLIGGRSAILAPALTSRYARSTLLVDADGTRLTLDEGLEAWTPDGRTVFLPGIAIVETKTPGQPSEADRVLWSLGYRPARVSKFCTCLAALRPELPSNRWTRVLRQPWRLAVSRATRATPITDRSWSLAG